MKIIGGGAEAIIYREDDCVIKDRIKKSYRHEQIDESLRTFRTKKEAKIIIALHKVGVSVPKIIKQESTILTIEFIDGMPLKKILDERPELTKQIGKHLAQIHDAGIIHGDLTTSNMLVKNNHGKEEIFFIDFGLSFNSKKIEDKAVDIHLFKQALDSKHYKVADIAYTYFLKGYIPKDRESILMRLADVEKRGRNKEKF